MASKAGKREGVSRRRTRRPVRHGERERAGSPGPGGRCSPSVPRRSTTPPAAVSGAVGHHSLRQVGRGGTTPGKGTNGTPPARSRRASRQAEIASGGRPLWQRRPRSSPRAGKPRTWRRGTGIRTARKGRYAGCEQPNKYSPSSTTVAGRLDHGTLESPGAPGDAKVSSTVRRGADGKVPE
jgi:hypothetical protein